MSKVQSFRSLMNEMRDVARGKKAAPPDAARSSFESVEALVRLLTPDNRRLLATIRDRKPQSIAALSRLTGRAQPNLTRTLAKLETAGLVETRIEGNRKAYRVRVRKVRVEIDPFSEHDKLDVA
jgi:predicted transcriptional regulator